MAAEPKTVHVTAGSKLDWLVEAAKETPIILEKDGVRYRVSREDDDLWATYDAEAVLAGIRAAGGSLSPDEDEELEGNIHRAREEGSRPTDHRHSHRA